MPVAKIVILNWNGAEHLRRFLPSVVAAAPAGVEVVVADNGSTDDSLRVLATEFPSVGVLRLDANYGFAGGYNRALKQVDADYYLLLNSDIETPEGWLAPILDVLEREPDVAVVSPKLISWTDRTKFEYAGASGGFIDFLGYPFCRGRILKVIVEACQLTQEEKVKVCQIVTLAGADFIKTSTGFSTGGATVEDVALFRANIGPDVRIKAAGGIRTFEQAQAMLDAGADRIGASALVGLMEA